MFNALIFILIFISSFCYSAESQMDLRIDTNPSQLQYNSSFNVGFLNSVESPENLHNLLVNPHITFHTNGGVDFSMTVGHRHRFPKFVLGHYVFYDKSHFNFLQLDQLGTGVDFLTRFFDVRANYYHPLLKKPTEFAIYPSKWVDGEIFFKTKYFGIGTGPLFNVDLKSWALHSRLIVPFNKISFHLGAMCGAGEWGQSKAVFSISFHLFKPKHEDRIKTFPCHIQRSNLYYTGVYVPDDAPLQTMMSIPKKHLYPAKDVEKYLDLMEENATLQDKSFRRKK